MGFLIDNYRKGWSLRYLREAKADLAVAERTPVPVVAISLGILSMRKAQMAIYYALGDPYYLEPIVKNMIGKKESLRDPLIRCLIQVEQVIQRRSGMPEAQGKDAVLQDANHIIDMASDIIGSMIGETLEGQA